MKLKHGIPTTSSMGAMLARTGVSGRSFLMSITYGQERHRVAGKFNALIIRDGKHWQSDFETLENRLSELTEGLQLRLVNQPNGMKHGLALVCNPRFNEGFQNGESNV
ncbi:hypothetical protein Kuja_0970 [Vibrio phage vB_VchM_Kuja]|uniref:Uncharacterized protein n=1 Tax=Vibrio phage vB_VchM_Kuja TaxID=2686437 RepID=A0A6B9J5Q6_9CAUD|nr:hypothetical protein HWC83_gp139 [Vibrio phage vB_VchM_Kuja]QGZ16088.1 hypothetical protein Kuja_0970 [Vibrio phage vB_VchM_Kuja]